MGCPSSPIEKLPEDILLRILLSLPLVDAVATRPLSRRWNYLWEQSCSQHSNLCFDIDSLLGCDMPYPKYRKQRKYMKFRKNVTLWGVVHYTGLSTEIIEDFIKGVDMIVHHRHRGKQQDALLGVNSLEIRFPLCVKHSNHIDNWLSSTVTSATKQLIIDLDIRSDASSSYKVSDYYELSFEMLQAHKCSSLEHLHLELVSTIIPRNFDGLPALRTLELHNTALNQENFQNMLENCPLLEILKIYYCGLVSLEVSSPLPNLKVLVIHRCGDLIRIELWAENLSNFEYDSAGYVQHLMLRGSHNLTTVAIASLDIDDDYFHPLSNDLPLVRTLYLNSDLDDMSVVLRGSIFAHLRFLAIFVAYSNDEREIQNMPSLLNDFAPMLEELELHLAGLGGSQKNSKKSKRRIDGDCYNHLKRVAFTGFTGATGQTWVAKYFLMKARRLEIMTIDARSRFYKNFDSVQCSGRSDVSKRCRNAYNLLCKETPEDAKLIFIDN